MTDAEYLLWLLSVVPVAVVLFSAYMDRQRSLLSPFWGMCFPVFAGTLLTISLHLTGTGSTALVDSYAGLRTNQLIVSLYTVVLFVTCTSVAYFSFHADASGRTVPVSAFQRQARLNGMATIAVTLLILACSAISLYFLLKASAGASGVITDFSAKRRIEEQSGSVSSGGIYRVIINLTRVNAIALLAVWYRFSNLRRNPHLLASIFLSTVITAINSVAISERTSLLLLIIPLVGTMKAEKVISVTQVIWGLVLAIIFANLVVIFRPSKGSETLELNEMIRQTLETPTRFAGNLSGPDVTKISRIRMYCDQQSEFFYGRTFVEWPIAIVPKAIWPNKPVLNLDRFVTQAVYGGIADVNMGAIPPSLVGECYMNAGWFGILLGGMAYGMALKIYAARLFPQQRSTVFSLYAFLISLPLLTHLLTMNYFGQVMIKIGVDLVSGIAVLLVYKQFALRETREVEYYLIELDADPV